MKLHSTQCNIVKVRPGTQVKKVCARYLRYPDITGKRKAEGGLRLHEKYKTSLPDKPLTSIITVVLNNEEFIERCMFSVFQQTWKNIEYIIVDGGSTDKTLSIIQSYNDSIDYFVSEPDTGVYHAMNKGIALSSGEYIGIINSDDYYFDQSVEKLITPYLKDKSICYTFGDALRNNNSIYSGSEHSEKVFFTTPFPHSTMMVSDKCYNKYGHYDESFRIAADYDFMSKLFINSVKNFYIGEAVAFYQRGGLSSISNTELRSVNQSERDRIKKKYFSSQLAIAPSELNFLYPFYEYVYHGKKEIPNSDVLLKKLQKITESDNKDMAINFLISYAFFLAKEIKKARVPLIKKFIIILRNEGLFFAIHKTIVFFKKQSNFFSLRGIRK